MRDFFGGFVQGIGMGFGLVVSLTIMRVILG